MVIERYRCAHCARGTRGGIDKGGPKLYAEVKRGKNICR